MENKWTQNRLKKSLNQSFRYIIYSVDNSLILLKTDWWEYYSLSYNTPPNKSIDNLKKLSGKTNNQKSS